MTPSKARFEKYCEDHRLVAIDPSGAATKRLIERAWRAAERGWHVRVSAAIDNLCSCGGGVPDDPHTWAGCKLYHALRLGEEEL